MNTNSFGLSTGRLIGLVVLCAALIFGVVSCGYVVSVNNREVRLRQTIVAKQRDNTSEFDNMWKKIAQVANVTEMQKDSLKEIFVGYAQARSGGAEAGGSLATWIHESVPNVDTKTFENLQNIIVGSRDAWTQRQKELLDMSREHNILLNEFPSGIVLSIFGREAIEIKIVTSSRTENSFETGKDDDVQLYKK